MNKKLKAEKGVLIIEVLIVITLIATVLTSLLGAAGFSLKILNSVKQTNRANFLAQETIEAVRSFRNETDWSVDGLEALTTDIEYYVQKSGSPSKWVMVEGVETISEFTRKVIFEDVMRDLNDNIVESGGVNNADTKKARVIVSWGDQNIEIATYFTNWRQ